MKISLITLFLAVCLLSSIGSTSRVYTEPEYPENLLEFLDTLKTVVLKHDKDRFIELLDEDYKRQQHDGFMMGNTKRFLDNFFCGYDPNDDELYECMPFETIQTISIASIVPDDKLFIITLNISDSDSNVDVLIIVSLNFVDGKEELRLIGAYG